MASHLNQAFTLKKFTYVAITMAVFGMLLVDQTSARYLDDECRGVMGNRDLYEYIVRICDDCENIFRKNSIGAKCRKNCFYNLDFMWCVHATERTDEIEHLNRAMSVIRVGRK
ncbi:molt-inhibiting hormone-like [Palaemon carinicauda]|uniref:molt-inhibiting hormone-like n=1 Tax=Palaemon carinicauda TaxID=392227 RepID=UPI0035B5D452